MISETGDDLEDEPYDWWYESEPDVSLDLHEGNFIQHVWEHNQSEPHDLCELPLPQTKCARVDDIPSCSIEGCFTEKFVGTAAKVLGSQQMVFESMEVAETPANAESLWAPFHNEAEWELVRFLVKNIGQTRIDELLKLDINGMSFDNAQSLLKYMDQLHTRPAWTCEMIDVEGDIVAEDGTLKHKQLELWQYNPVECIWELMGNPAFREAMSYVPKHAYTDARGKNCIYDEMWTGEWWWDMQKRLPEGAMVTPVILSSDKMTLSQFSRDKKAWPVYLTIGNISKDIRCQVSAHATLLIGYLPVSKLKCFHKKTQSLAGYHLFHHVMSLLLHPLVDASHHGKEMICADGYLHRVHPMLAAYIADFPEQCLVGCTKESCCPRCLVESNKHGDLEDWVSRSLHAVFDPFWKELPFTNIFTCLTPDILHQLHKGIFHDHLLQWCISIIGKKEIDMHFQAMTQYPGLRHFKKGISSVMQWTGTEHKEMERVFIGLLASAVDDHVLVVVHSLLDFIYYAQLQQHMDTTLTAMEESLKMFHSHKHILVELQVREDFNMPKIHSMKHYVSLIQALSSADGYNTEYPKWLHINYAKDGYQ
ncbi:hypothetical protein PISMIDRAFT_103675 [Pisolithus microcarpus 441]|uniref:Uncharacterized protein n=1 Tax=Pisolithus microcarpus 441 TaxID=765257 RepID=A0A0C9Z6C4_9AGAM|nr:hypothetical protein BKA83DRAFT_103675 [Pisolithus microcarpus]KIK21664.1 hypothetical protein PISMIDRAFT_103675 [Pisolithus microcarpus 441]